MKMQIQEEKSENKYSERTTENQLSVYRGSLYGESGTKKIRLRDQFAHLSKFLNVYIPVLGCAVDLIIPANERAGR